MKKTVFITGATGTMGMKTVEKFVPHTDEFNIRVLARDSAKNREKLSTFGDGIEVIWGDLKDDDKLRDGVKDADYVLAIGAFLSPFCDEVPYDALRTNYGSTLSMLKSIKEFGQEEKTHFVYIGTVAQTGDRMPPIHWGRVGDPMKPSVYDYYAVSKVFSEMAVMESGLKYWASIRQSSMMPVNPKSGEYPILSHQPYNNVLEWSTAEDSANLMLNICMRAPEHFWRRAYNLSNGKDFRCTTFSFYESLYQDPRETQEPNWLATNNFHGHCYLDSDDLENVVPFRTKTFDEAMFDQLGAFMENAMNAEPGSMPTTIEESKENNRRIMSKPGGVLQFVADGDEERIKVWFGSREKYDAIPKDWDGCIIAKPLNLPGKPLDRGFDECKPVEELGIDDMRQAAKFRGGECLSESMDNGDLYSPLKWRCADGHEFEACPYTVLFAGHWCPECMQDSWHYGDIAKKNPFFAQVWWPLHKDEEPYGVKMEANARDIEKLYK